jgi:hypothetical protein
MLPTGVYRWRHNFELEREFDSPCVMNIVKMNKSRYAGNPKTYHRKQPI